MTEESKKQANRVAEEENVSRMIFVNLPVADLERSKRFYEALGARNEPKFSNEAAAMMVVSETISVMLLTHDFYRTFTSKQIADPRQTSQVLLCLSCDSPAEVDRMVEAAADAGGKADPGPKQDIAGMMYGRSFEDPDGHHWEPMWMNASAAEQGASAYEQPADATADRH
jgi:predicted lactoylglutathione lyase